MWFSAVGLNSTQITDIIFAQIEQFICNIETVRYDCIKIKTTSLKKKKKSGLWSVPKTISTLFV